MPKHLADIIFPYHPFGNDLPYENFNFSEPGQSFYQRRGGSDLPAYYSGENAWGSIIENPGGIGIEGAHESFQKIVKAVGSPLGQGEGQHRVAPLYQAWFDFVQVKPGQNYELWRLAKKLFKRPESLAQEFAGLDALAMSKQDMYKAVENAQEMGIISHEVAKTLKKRKNISLLTLLILPLLRDFPSILAITATSSFVSEAPRGLNFGGGGGGGRH